MNIVNIGGSELQVDGMNFTLIRYAKIWWTHHGFDKLTGSRRRGFPMSAIGRINLKLYHSVEWTIDESFISFMSCNMRNSCKGRDTWYSWGVANRVYLLNISRIINAAERGINYIVNRGRSGIHLRDSWILVPNNTRILETLSPQWYPR